MSHPIRRTLAVPALVAVTALLLTGCGEPAASPGATGATGADTATTTTPSSAPVPALQDGNAPDVPGSMTQVPDDFPLAAGLPDVNGDDGSPVTVTDTPTWTEVELCGEVVWSLDGPVAGRDLAGASYTGEAEDTRSRLLAVYDDSLDSQEALDTLRDSYAACPDGSVGGTDQVYEVVASEQGSAVVTHRYRTDGRFDTGLEVIEIVSVGNALYLSSYYGEGGGSADTIASAIAFARESSQPVRRAMAVFADGAADAPADAADDDLANFPLAAGWPDDVEPGEPGAQVPVDALEPSFSSFTCLAETPEPADAVEVLRGRLSNIEDFRTRELVTFPDADAAVAYVSVLDAFYRECPSQTEDDGVVYPVTRIPTRVGGQSFGVVRSTEYDGRPAIGISALQVVRVGSAVLLDTSSTEGSGSPDATTAGTRLLDAMTVDSAEVVAGMCVFTEAGC